MSELGQLCVLKLAQLMLELGVAMRLTHPNLNPQHNVLWPSC